MGVKGGRVVKNMYKGQMGKTKEWKYQGCEMGMAWVRESHGRLWRQLYLNSKNTFKKYKTENY